MRIFKWLFLAVVWSLLAMFLHYTLPQTDVVRIVDTEVRRVDFGENSIFWAQADTGNEAGTVNRDVRFIETVDSDGDVKVYRNEDTGWGWPPYFKLDSSNLQAEAANLISTREAPQWVTIRHYGWRSQLLSIFPNAVSIRPVAGPEVRVIPWVAIVVVIVLLALVWAIYSRWRRFRAARIDPRLDAMDAAWDERRLRWAERRRAKREARLRN